jgi:hypothetical protein
VTVDPSSLIFVVIVAIWAAYLLGHWVRRRDQVATVRSVDRFSDAMRVLERRPAVRSVPLSRPNPRSYVVAPARTAQPQVSVKRAPSVTRPVERPLAAPAQPAAPATAAVRRTSSQAARRTPGRTVRLARGLVLLALLAATPSTWLLVAVTDVVAWWVAGLVTVALVAMVAYLRHAARQARVLARRRQRLDSSVASQARRQARRQVVGEVVASHRERPAAAQTPDAGEPEAAAEPPQPSGWQPVPVPPPTYTLKPKAPPRSRPVAASAVPAVSSPAPVATSPAAAPVTAAAVAPAFDLDEILERRIASGS